MENPEPTPEEIGRRFLDIQKETYPDFRIESVSVRISNRMTRTAAKVSWKINSSEQGTAVSLTISRPYHRKFGWGLELNRTLRHEIIHPAASCHGHGWKFRQELEKVGASRYCHHMRSDIPLDLFQCRGCGHTYSSLKDEIWCPECEDIVDWIGSIETN